VGIGADRLDDLLGGHAAYGCAVTLTCRMRRLSSERTKNTYSTLNVTVGTNVVGVPARRDQGDRVRLSTSMTVSKSARSVALFLDRWTPPG
jgi:hypothetical protein